MPSIHYSTKKFGDMRKNKNQVEFLKHLHLDPTALIIPEQIHGDRIIHVGINNRGEVMEGADGLVSADPSVILGVLAADCPSLIFVDSKKHILAVAHAGWRGTIAGIAAKTVEAMRGLGSHPEDIVVSIGPHIGVCCYDVPEERSLRFQKVFGDGVTAGGFVNLGKANYVTLIKSGIAAGHINISDICTSCDHRYFSYRRDKGASFGETLGVVAWE